MKPLAPFVANLFILGSCLFLVHADLSSVVCAASAGGDNAREETSTSAKTNAPSGPARRPQTPLELKYWLENMVVHHDFTVEEVCMATGMTRDEVGQALDAFQLSERQPAAREATQPLKVLPYPGGRHPRVGFLEGAIRPQRETKISIFTPWDASSYVVADIPEAIWSNLGLTYLAHTHIPTIWDEQGLELPQLEWTRHSEGSLDFERRLPNGVTFGTKVRPTSKAVRMEMWIHNGTKETLTDLRVQNCIMLKGAPEFVGHPQEISMTHPPYAAMPSSEAQRWLITAWAPLDRVWANPDVPCLHSDPRFPDCAPGETVLIQGWLSFYEGQKIEQELARIEETGWRGKPGPSSSSQ